MVAQLYIRLDSEIVRDCILEAVGRAETSVSGGPTSALDPDRKPPNPAEPIGKKTGRTMTAV